MTDRDEPVRTRGDVDDWLTARLGRWLMRAGVTAVLVVFGAGAWFTKLEVANAAQNTRLAAIGKRDTALTARVDSIKAEQDSTRQALRYLPSIIADSVMARLRRGR